MLALDAKTASCLAYRSRCFGYAHQPKDGDAAVGRIIHRCCWPCGACHTPNHCVKKDPRKIFGAITFQTQWGAGWHLRLNYLLYGRPPIDPIVSVCSWLPHSPTLCPAWFPNMWQQELYAWTCIWANKGCSSSSRYMTCIFRNLMVSPGSQHEFTLIFIIFHLLCPFGPWALILGPRQLLGRQVVPVRGPKVLGSFGIIYYIP